MAGAILSLKQNRALLKKRNIRDLKSLLYEKSGKTALEFKKISSRELAKIKIEIRKEARIHARKEMAIYGISFVLVGIIVYLVYLLFST